MNFFLGFVAYFLVVLVVHVALAVHYALYSDRKILRGEFGETVDEREKNVFIALMWPLTLPVWFVWSTVLAVYRLMIRINDKVVQLVDSHKSK